MYTQGLPSFIPKVISPKGGLKGLKSMSSFAVLNAKARDEHKDCTAEHFYKFARKLSFWKHPSKEMGTLVEQTSLASSISVGSLESPA